jgi:hypothetical protein
MKFQVIKPGAIMADGFQLPRETGAVIEIPDADTKRIELYKKSVSVSVPTPEKKVKDAK